MFIDYSRISVQGGQGGSGCCSFRREKFIPKGGPDGGDGGRGGSIIIVADGNLRTLIDFRYRREYKAKHGIHGMGANKHGKKAEDVIIKVPVGTLIRDMDSGEIVHDMVEDGQKFVAAKGGRGGRGNARFSTPTNRAPREWEVGKPGEERNLELELKLIADVGLVGLPNAGKSTLLSRLSAARPRIADYPFTTLEPNLGIVSVGDFQSFVMADIPGLIEGAHKGKGLGHQFLRHIERTRVLAYLIDCTEEEPEKTFEILYNELKEFSQQLIKKPYLILLTKIDVTDPGDKANRFNGAVSVLPISSVAGTNLDKVKDQLTQLISNLDNEKL